MLHKKNVTHPRVATETSRLSEKKMLQKKIVPKKMLQQQKMLHRVATETSRLSVLFEKSLGLRWKEVGVCVYKYVYMYL